MYDLYQHSNIKHCSVEMSWDALSTIYYHHKVEIHYIPKQQKEREEKKEKQKEKKKI